MQADSQYVQKGMKVMVRGRIHYTSWTDQDDIKRYGTEIIADEVTFLTRARQAAEQQDDRDHSIDDDDIPF